MARLSRYTRSGIESGSVDGGTCEDAAMVDGNDIGAALLRESLNRVGATTAVNREVQTSN